MAGVPFDILEGWAIPAQAVNAWDHTYVVSSLGLRWGCFGRDRGGRLIRGAAGSTPLADCLSKPNSQAGISYLRTGVCHQAANRILHAAGQLTVAGCNGYAVSTFMFRVYGLGAWPQLAACAQGQTVVKSTGTGGPDRNDSVRLAKYDQAISRVHAEAADEESIRLGELSALIESTLGRPLDKQTFDALATIQMKLQRAQSDLVQALDRGLLGPEQYLEAVNTALRKAMADSRDLLGRDRFSTIFGQAGFEPEGLIDKDAFLSGHAARMR